MRSKRFGNKRYSAKKGWNQDISGSVYTARSSLKKSDEVRMRQTMSNDYSKRGSAPDPDMPGPVPGMPRRTQRIVR